ncbi:unnamed protein product [Miscanthus lutarioriparius]|uniref:Uncharacterized protein n=1 Tax=Miscanthus lutarioriparius TaxID=422564 RepID=A0A811PIF4_9POAL|nr:unnamed protein product [Miscanthus lutarioriparius]
MASTAAAPDHVKPPPAVTETQQPLGSGSGSTGEMGHGKRPHQVEHAGRSARRRPNVEGGVSQTFAVPKLFIRRPPPSRSLATALTTLAAAAADSFRAEADPSPPSSVLSSGNGGVVGDDAAHQLVPEPERTVIIDLELDPSSQPDSAPTDHPVSAAESSSQAGTPVNVDDAAHHHHHHHVFTSAFGAKKQRRYAVDKALQLQVAATQAFLDAIAKEAERADAAEQLAGEMAQRAAMAEQRAHRLASDIDRCRSEAQRMADELQKAVHEVEGCAGIRALQVQYGEPKLDRPGSSKRPGKRA